MEQVHFNQDKSQEIGVKLFPLFAFKPSAEDFLENLELMHVRGLGQHG
jgi:hypothetical protein